GEAWREFCRLLGAIFHYEYFAELEHLKEAYYYFNPHHPGERPDKVAMEAAYLELVKALEHVLARANFVHVSKAEIDRACHTVALMPAEIYTPLEDYRDIRFFRRGQHAEDVELVRWFGLKKEKRTIEVYNDVVLIAAAKPLEELASKGQLKRVRRGRLTNGGMIIKYFRDIASADLNTLLPNVRVIMSLRDKWFLGVPALVGGVPLLLKLAPVLTVLAVLAGIHFSANETVHEDLLKDALVVMSGLLALGGFVTHQWLKYQAQSLRYQLAITDNLYFRNLNNNA